MGGIRGGMVEIGTSSIVGLERERWVDIEQRAALYSPDPKAAVVRANGTRSQRGVVTPKEVELAKKESSRTGEEDYFTLARPPSWFRDRKGHDPKDVFVSSKESLPVHESSRGSRTFLPANDVLTVVAVVAGKEPWRSTSLP